MNKQDFKYYSIVFLIMVLPMLIFLSMIYLIYTIKKYWC